MKQETFNMIINYLATKPYNEVAPIFDAIMKDMDVNKDTATVVEEVKSDIKE